MSFQYTWTAIEQRLRNEETIHTTFANLSSTMNTTVHLLIRMLLLFVIVLFSSTLSIIFAVCISWRMSLWTTPILWLSPSWNTSAISLPWLNKNLHGRFKTIWSGVSWWVASSWCHIPFVRSNKTLFKCSKARRLNDSVRCSAPTRSMKTWG